MMKANQLTLFAVVVGLCLPGSGPAYAQQDSQANELIIEEILVLATRRAESLQDAGVAVTSVDVGDFRDIGLDSLGDITGYTPGVNLVSSGPPGLAQINMRGITQEAGSPIVGIYIDDVPVTTSNVGGTIGINIFDGLLGDVERVEVVKGPQGTLFGANSVGGVIRYVTRDPSMDDFRGEVSADIASIGGGGLSQTYRANVSIPLVQDKLGITVAGFRADKAGWVDQLDFAGTAVIASEVNDSEQEGYSAILQWDISDNASVRVTSLHSELDYAHAGTTPFDQPSFAPTFGEYRTNLTGNITTTEFDSLSLAFELDFDWATLNIMAANTEYENKAPLDLSQVFTEALFDSGALGPAAVGNHPDTLDPAGAPHNFINDLVAGYDKDVAEIRVTSADSDVFEWLIGGFYTEESTQDQQLFGPTPPISGFDYGSFLVPATYEETSFFANATYFITPNFDISAGLRSTKTDLGVEVNLTGLLLLGDPNASMSLTPEGNEDVETYMIGARWRVNDEASLYLRAASGFRPGFINPPLLGSGLVVNSDEMWSYEIGAKGNFANGKVIYDIAVWTMDWEDFQANLGLVTGNATSSISGNGIESSFIFYPSDQFSVQASFSYTNSELDDDDLGLGGVAGDKTRFIPDLTASVLAGYEFEVGGFDASLGGGIRYMSDFATAYSFEPGTTTPKLNFRVPSSTLVDLNARLAGERFAATLYINNALDKYSISNGTVLFGQATGTTVAPRTVGVNLSYSF